MSNFLIAKNGYPLVDLKKLNFREAYSLLVIKELSAIDIVDLANFWLDQEIFSENLTEIYDHKQPYFNEVVPPFEGFMVESGMERPSLLIAAQNLVSSVCQQISRSKISPVLGAEYIYWNIHHAITSEFPDSKYLGSNLGVELIFTWLREYWDCQDGSRLNYHSDLERPEAATKFKSYIVEEAQAWLERQKPQV